MALQPLSIRACSALSASGAAARSGEVGRPLSALADVDYKLRAIGQDGTFRQCHGLMPHRLAKGRYNDTASRVCFVPWAQDVISGMSMSPRVWRVMLTSTVEKISHKGRLREGESQFTVTQWRNDCRDTTVPRRVLTTTCFSVQHSRYRGKERARQ